MYQRRGNFHRCEFHAVGFKRERGGEGFFSREISGALFEQVEADVMIVHQAVAHAVGERLAEIISVADVRRV